MNEFERKLKSSRLYDATSHHAAWNGRASHPTATLRSNMAINQSPVITVQTNDPPFQVNVEALRGPGGTTPDTTSTLTVNDLAPGIASIALHPTNPRAVVITPGGTPAAALSLFVAESPSADINLEIRLVVVAPPSLRQIVYVSHGPVE
jgi:hypothetical protein